MTTILIGDCRTMLATLPDGLARCCVTSPPYFHQRDYDVEGQMGLEATPDEYVTSLVDVFRHVRRVLADDGTLWLNLGDSYASGGRGGGGSFMAERGTGAWNMCGAATGRRKPSRGLKHKDLIGIPWRVALALQADGWYLRSEIIWHKPNPFPETVSDRPSRCHEQVFLLAKAPRYYYDKDAVREKTGREATPEAWAQRYRGDFMVDKSQRKRSGMSGKKALGYRVHTHPLGRNRRTVWSVAARASGLAHYATFPTALAEPCILAGSAVGDTVLDPFGGAGTTALVAEQHGRKSVLIELNPKYAAIARKRIDDWTRTSVALAEATT